MVLGLDMRFLGRKWGRKNKGKSKGNRINSFAPFGFASSLCRAVARFAAIQTGMKPRSVPGRKSNSPVAGGGFRSAHRKVRDGWGTRAVVAREERQRQKQIPFGMTTRKA